MSSPEETILNVAMSASLEQDSEKKYWVDSLQEHINQKDWFGLLLRYLQSNQFRVFVDLYQSCNQAIVDLAEEEFYKLGSSTSEETEVSSTVLQRLINALEAFSQTNRELYASLGLQSFHQDLSAFAERLEAQKAATASQPAQEEEPEEIPGRGANILQRTFGGLFRGRTPSKNPIGLTTQGGASVAHATTSEPILVPGDGLSELMADRGLTEQVALLEHREEVKKELDAFFDSKPNLVDTLDKLRGTRQLRELHQLLMSEPEARGMFDGWIRDQIAPLIRTAKTSINQELPNRGKAISAENVQAVLSRVLSDTSSGFSLNDISWFLLDLKGSGLEFAQAIGDIQSVQKKAWLRKNMD